jgi:hypothetical protein
MLISIPLNFTILLIWCLIYVVNPLNWYDWAKRCMGLTYLTQFALLAAWLAVTHRLVYGVWVPVKPCEKLSPE